MASPRCHSRDSSTGGRCPSDDSNYSGGRNRASSPIAITLPATLAPGAAASLLPPQSAAMAAYLGAAAVAAQQNRLLLNNHHALTAMGRGGSSPPLASPQGSESSVLDFSIKPKLEYEDQKCDNGAGIGGGNAVNLIKSDNGPLDLTVNRKRYNSSPPPSSRKVSRPDYKQPVVSPWTTPMAPYFAAAVAAASLSPKNQNVNDWNSKNKIAQNDATKALEKMSELSRIGGNDVGRQSTNSSSASSGRHSAWQSHWLNKGADSVKDVFKCVWCKLSFPTLESLTTHMKETQHMGSHVPHSNNSSQQQSHQSQQQHQQQQQQQQQHHQSPASAASAAAQAKSDLNLLIKETMPLPRKLVRGQDVWLGKGAEQTRQILKCMWCGQSFRSLSEMTTHMQQTQHYTNIISQEQIISWKSSDDAKGVGSGPSGNGQNASGSASSANSTVSAVLTCKVCDQAFTSLKDLSNHMVKNAHYKEHIMRSISESGGRRRQTREKRKKSLPVRKLLELERAQHDFKNGDTNIHQLNKSMRDVGRITCDKCGDKIDAVMFVEHIRQCVGGDVINSQRNNLKSALMSNTIIPPDSHSPLTPTSRDGRKSIGDESASSPNSRHISPNTVSPVSKDGLGGSGSAEKNNSPSVLNALEQLIEKSFDTRTRHGNNSNAYAANNQQSAPLGSSILKRLGIDESVDYTKPLIDPQTMNFLRSYSQQSAASQYDRRERSGSESSSVSERGSSRMHSLTPERKLDLPQQHGNSSNTPRATPDKINHDGDYADDHHNKLPVNIKSEPMDDEDHSKPISNQNADQLTNVSIKRELDDEDRPTKTIKQEIDGENLSKRRSSTITSPAPSPRQSTPGAHQTPMASPCSDRSITPRSTPGIVEKKPSTSSSGSLGALSSMFDSLAGTSSSTSNTNDQPSQNKKGSSHPLAALQKLCDKTENSPQNPRQTGGPQALAAPTSQPSSGNTASGAILAFSWACNDAVMTSDSIIKCKLCDTPFCSKGAYRHHLSKVHFVNDDVMLESNATLRAESSAAQHQQQQQQHQQQHQQQKPSPRQHSSPSATAHSPKSSANSNSSTGNSNNNGGANAAATAKSPSPSMQPGAAFEESPHSKFLKYTELAKQLSSKYV